MLNSNKIDIVAKMTFAFVQDQTFNSYFFELVDLGNGIELKK